MITAIIDKQDRVTAEDVRNPATDLGQYCEWTTTLNAFTNSRRTLREHSEGLFNAFKARSAACRPTPPRWTPHSSVNRSLARAAQ